MKKTQFTFPLFILYLLLISISTYAQFALERDKYNEIYLDFKIPAYSLSEQIIDGEIFTSILIDDASIVMKKGEPALQYFTQSISIPNDARMSVKTTEITYKEIPVKKIVPSKGNILKIQSDENIPLVYGEAYQKDAFYKSNIAYLSDPFILRDIRGITIQVYPFQYNPQKGILKVIESMKLVVYQDGVSDKNVLTRNSKGVTKIFDDIYKRMFINYQTNRYTSIPDGEKMVVITHPDFKESVEPFVKWKNQKGIKTSLYEYSSLSDVGSTISSLKAFIKKMYNDSNITYFILVGDYEKIPSPLKTYGNETVSTDPTLVKLVGDDHYVDAFIGRLSVQTKGSANIVINKILKYEKEPDLNKEWYKRAVGIASSEGSPNDISWIRNMGKVLLGYNYTRIDSIYQGKSPSTSKLTTYVNEGRGWINFMGHGNATGFGFQSGFWYTNEFANGLVNAEKLPVVISVACNNGNFKGKNCFAEVWQKNPNGGAVAFLGSSPLQDWKPPQDGQKEMVRLLSIDKYLTLGAIVYNGMAKMVEVKGAAATKTSDTWILFGDPSMMVFTDAPKELNVTVPININRAETTIDVDFGEPVDGRVAVYNEGNGILVSQVVKNSDVVSLPISFTNEREVTITVTARNKAPYIQKVIVDGTVGINDVNVTNVKSGISLISPSKLSLSVSTSGTYDITIYSVNGKSLFNKKVEINKGNSIIDLKGLSLSKSVYLVKIVGTHMSVKERIVLK